MRSDYHTSDIVGSDSIRSVRRALDLIGAMNLRDASSVGELHELLNLPKPTICRILQTLESAGYVVAEGTMGRYRLTSKVLELSAGYTLGNCLIDSGSSVALAETKKIKWPLAIGTLDHDEIVVRYSTMPYTPLSLRPTTVGRRLGLLDTAMGMTYLAYLEEDNRTKLLSSCFHSEGYVLAARTAQIREVLTEIRDRGYGLRLPSRERQNATLAVPILSKTHIIGVLGMTIFGNSMTPAVIAKFPKLLEATARKISNEYEKNSHAITLGPLEALHG